MPSQGYAEMNSKNLTDRKVHVATALGNIKLTFFSGCMSGFPRGQKLSVMGYNVVSKAKMKQWELESKTHKMRINNGFHLVCNNEAEIGSKIGIQCPLEDVMQRCLPGCRRQKQAGLTSTTEKKENMNKFFT